MKIHSPAKGYTATDVYGTTEIKFEDGVAEFDGDLPAGIRQYLIGAGYGLDEEPAEPEPAPEPADPRDLPDGALGTPLRDAAVDPRPEDFLAPTNAGQANPHGPEVVSPEIHASQGVRPVKGGEVHVTEPEKQDEAEKAHVETVLAEGTSAVAEPELPEGEPDESWKNDQIKEWAEAHNVDLAGATKKDDMLAVIRIVEPGTGDGSTPPQS